MLARCLVLLALPIMALAQERVSAVATIVASGDGCAAGATLRFLDTRGEFVDLLRQLHWQGEVPEVDCSKRALRFVPLGTGSGGTIRVTQIARGESVVVRLEGDPKAAIAAGRWVVVSHDHRLAQELSFETDSDGDGKQHVYRTVGVAPDAPHRESGTLLLPMIVDTVKPPDTRRLFTDTLAFADFCREQKQVQDGTSLTPFPKYIDFGKTVVLVRPMDNQPQRADSAQPLEFFLTNHGTLVRPLHYVPLQETKAANPQQLFGIYFVPRVTGRVDYEVPVAGRRGEFHRTARFTIEDPATAKKLPVLRFVDREVQQRETTLCQRITTRAEWKQVCKEFDEFADLGDDWCDFTSASIVVLATAAGRVFPGFELSVVEEEGVDVLTAKQFAPSGVDPGSHSYAMLAVVPHRKGQLAVVLRSQCGPGPGSEATLRVFPGQRQ